jgi:hypothetical protein
MRELTLDSRTNLLLILWKSAQLQDSDLIVSRPIEFSNSRVHVLMLKMSTTGVEPWKTEEVMEKASEVGMDEGEVIVRERAPDALTQPVAAPHVASAKKRKRWEEPRPEPVRTQPRRGKKVEEAADAAEAARAETDKPAEAVGPSEPARKRVRFASQTENEAGSSAAVDVGTGKAVMDTEPSPAALSGDKEVTTQSRGVARRKGKGIPDVRGKPKRGRGRQAKATPPSAVVEDADVAMVDAAAPGAAAPAGAAMETEHAATDKAIPNAPSTQSKVTTKGEGKARSDILDPPGKPDVLGKPHHAVRADAEVDRAGIAAPGAAAPLGAAMEAGQSAVAEAMPSEVPSKAAAKGKGKARSDIRDAPGQSDILDKPKKGRGRPRKGGLAAAVEDVEMAGIAAPGAVAAVGATMEAVHAGAHETVPNGAKGKGKVVDTAATHIVWRGGLNQPLAEIMAREYSRITNPTGGAGKLQVYREWGAELGLAAVDPDGSRVRKGVARLIKEFEKASCLMEDGLHEQKELLAICPEFFVLLPVLRPDRAAAPDAAPPAERSGRQILLDNADDNEVSPAAVLPEAATSESARTPMVRSPASRKGKGRGNSSRVEKKKGPKSRGTPAPAPAPSSEEKSPVPDPLKRLYLRQRIDTLKGRLEAMSGDRLDQMYRWASEKGGVPLNF